MALDPFPAFFASVDRCSHLFLVAHHAKAKRNLNSIQGGKLLGVGSIHHPIPLTISVDSSPCVTRNTQCRHRAASRDHEGIKRDDDRERVVLLT